MRSFFANLVFSAILALVAVRVVCWLLHFFDVWVSHPWDMIAFVILYLVMVIPDFVHLYKHGPDDRNNDHFRWM